MVRPKKSYKREPIGSRICEIDWYQNEWPWPLFKGRTKVTSTIALYLTLNRPISETVRGIGSKGLPIENGIWAIEWSRDRWCHVTLKGQTRDPNTFSAISRKLFELETLNSVRSFVWGMPSGWHKKFPPSGRGLDHVTPTIFGIRSNISSKLLQLQTSNLIHIFVVCMGA